MPLYRGHASGRNVFLQSAHKKRHEEYLLTHFFTPARENCRSATRLCTGVVGRMFLPPHRVHVSQPISTCWFGLPNVARRLLRLVIRATFLSVRAKTRSRW